MGSFHNSLRILRWIYKIIGQDIFCESGYRRLPPFYLIVMLLSFMISFYTLDLLLTDDLRAVIRMGQSTILLGASEELCKFFALADLTKLRPIIDYFDTFHCENSRPSDKYYAIGRRYAGITERGLKIALAVFTGLACAVLLLAIYDSNRTGAPMLFLYFPTVHEYTSGQLLALDIFTGIINVAVAIIEPAGDAFIFVIVVSLTMIPTVIEQQMVELSARLEQRTATGREIKRRWIHYIRLHQNFNG